MEAAQLLRELVERGIHLIIEGNDLRIRAPKGALTDDLRTQLLVHRAEILALLRWEQQHAATVDPHEHGSFPLRIPLSSGQRRIWFAEHLYPHTCAYHVPVVTRVRGTLLPDRVEQALQHLIDRHDILRTTFHMHEGEPIQVIAESLKISVQVLNLSHHASVDEQNALLSQTLDAEARRPFDLERGPLLRMLLITHSDGDDQSQPAQTIIITMHHIITDGWSIQLLLEELATCYHALSHGHDEPPLASPVPYRELVRWQHTWLQSEQSQHQADYWRTQLAPPLPSLALPIAKPRPPIPHFHGASATTELPSPLVTALETLSRESQTTPYMVLVAAFLTLLHRYTGEEDIIIGCPINNRTRHPFERVIGFGVNSLVLRTNLTSDLSFRELLRRVRSVALDAYAHQDMPLEKIVELVQPERDSSRNPLFQVSFELQHTPPPLQAGEATLESHMFLSVAARLDMEWYIWQHASGYTLTIVYQRDLFEDEAIVRMRNHFLRILESATHNPDHTLATIPLLTDQEYAQLHTYGNPPPTPYPYNRTIHDLVESQAQQTPAAPALVCGTVTLSYHALNEQANQIAVWLIAQGIRPGAIVGICLERSAELVIALLGILKTGATYLPLDPEYPPQRLTWMLSDAHAAALVTSHPLSERLFSHTDNQPPIICCLDRDWPMIVMQPHAQLPSHLSADSLAYVIYTSGSTGIPKGVAISHRAVVNFLCSMREQPGLIANDTLLAVTTLSFDISVLELFLPLIVGAQVVLVPREVAADGERLAQALDDSGATVMQATPATWQLLLDSGWSGRESLRILCGGEALSWQLAQRLVQCGASVWNMYGPTETTIWSSIYRIPRTSDSHSHDHGNVPIGHPIANTRMLVLDQHGQVVPVGIPGELSIGGDGIAEGYWNRPNLTAERFPSLTCPPILPEPDRFYRTGDLVRWCADGTLEFLGRLDDQIKLRGIRIEPAEIEAALRDHPLVQDAVVLAQAHTTEDIRLTAYVVPLDTDDSAILDEVIESWRTIFDHYVTQSHVADDPHMNSAGWISSYTGAPMSQEEMQEWLNESVSLIRECEPQRVLEIGCGTGMVLFQVAPHCQTYWATDISQSSIDYVKNQLERNVAAPHLHLRVQPAHDFTGIPNEFFNVILLHSVIQYFPSVDYLQQVLAGALRALAPSGTIILGDVRILPLLEAFHTSVQLAQSDAAISCGALRERVRMSCTFENELVIDPALISLLRDHFPDIGHTEIRFKQGHIPNELQRFRCHLLLVKNPVPIDPMEPLWYDWQQEEMTTDTLHHILPPPAHHSFRPIIAIHRIPGAPASADYTIAELLRRAAPSLSLAQFRDALHHSVRDDVATLRDEIRTIAHTHGYRLQSHWSPTSPGIDIVLFIPKERFRSYVIVPPPTPPSPPRSWHTYATRPMQGLLCRRLPNLLRDALTLSLPPALVPAKILILDTIPRTPNGKIDRNALRHVAPPPDHSPISDDSTPATPIEQTLTRLWCDVLGTEQCHRDHHFFHQGGHSLLAIQLLARIRDAFRSDIPLRIIFEAPVLRDMALRIEQHQHTHPPTAHHLASIVSQPRAPDQLFPLSFAQERMWFLDQLAPTHALYTIVRAVRLTGPLDTAILTRTLIELLRRHESLRTTIALHNDRPMQRITDLAHWEAATTSWFHVRMMINEAEQMGSDTLVERIAQSEATRPFDLRHGPLFRVTLLQLDQSGHQHMLLLALHHIIADGWSLTILMRELTTLYTLFSDGNPSPLPDSPIQYADFACWQREWLHGDILEQQLTYWKAHLANIPPMISLPFDHPRPATPTLSGAHLPIHIPSSLANDLRQFSQQHDGTLFLTLLAAFQVLLARYTAQDDIAIGTPIANRPHASLASVVGLFVNTLVMRTNLAGNPSFAELLNRVRDGALSAYDHQDVPFEMVVEALQPVRDVGRTPLVHVMMTLEQEDEFYRGVSVVPPPVDPSVSFVPCAVFPAEVARFDLALVLTEAANGIGGAFEYSTDLFDHATIERLAQHFLVLLRSIVAQPHAPISHLPLLTAEEHHQIVHEWNATAADYPRTACIHHIVEQQAVQQPHAIALVQDGILCSYQELDQRANALAHHLQSLLPERQQHESPLVALCLPRSIDAIIAAFAILKVGAAYLPLDPSHPPERLSTLLGDASPPLLITSAPLLAVLTLPAATTALTIDDIELSPSDSAPILLSPPTADDLAYVIYTSGSTGMPRGVELGHRGLVNLVYWTHRTFDVTPRDHAAQMSAPGFDGAVWEVWTYLAAGATLHIPDEETRISPTLLQQWLLRHAITITYVPTPLTEQLLTFSWPAECALRILFTGGDTLRRFPPPAFPATLVNLYGPTENTVITTFAPLSPATDEQSLPPIGHPIANHQVYILDESLHPLPIGVTGMIFVAGHGLAWGYRNRPTETAERFLIPSDGPLTARRLYCTGDLGRYRKDGAIEFLGRADTQVKVRGVRIEPDEIAFVLCRHESVRDAVVLAHDDPHGERRLVAYVVPNDNQITGDAGTSLIGLLRDDLAAKLPQVMIPATYILLDHLPLTPNGKVDRAALPAPTFALPVHEGDYHPPQDPIQDAIAAIWSDVLALEHVSITDNFFELGGHSLLATQIIARVRAHFQIALPLRTLFESPSIAGLADAVKLVYEEKSVMDLKQTEVNQPSSQDIAPPPEDDQPSPPGNPATDLVESSDEVPDVPDLPEEPPPPPVQLPPFPLTEVQEAYWVGRQETLQLGNIGAHGYLELECRFVDIPRLQYAWQRLIERHEMLRAIILPDGNQQILVDIPPYQIGITNLSSAHDMNAVQWHLDQIRERMSHHVFAPDTWPLFELHATILNDGWVRLHLSIDGLIADGQSTQIIGQELAHLYDMPDAELPPLEYTFREYVLAERDFRTSDDYGRALKYWLDRLETLPSAPALPLCQTPETVTHPRFTRRTHTLDAPTWQRLKQRAAPHGLTPSLLILAVFAEVLTTWSRSARCTINLTLFNRLPFHPHVNQIVGDFTSLTLLAVDYSDPEPFLVRAQRLQQQLWDDLDHRAVGGVRVLRELARIRRDQTAARMPVVFTSMLTHPPLSEPSEPESEPESATVDAEDIPTEVIEPTESQIVDEDVVPAEVTEPIEEDETLAEVTEPTESEIVDEDVARIEPDEPPAPPPPPPPVSAMFPFARLAGGAQTVYSISQTPQVWIDHQVGESQDGALCYNWDTLDDLFPPGLLDEMIAVQHRFLQRLADDETAWQTLPQRLTPVAQLAQRTTINTTHHPLPTARDCFHVLPPTTPILLHTLFAEQAQRTPNQIAIVTPDYVITYDELSQRAYSLGMQLRQHGVARGSMVAIVMERGWEQVVAVLGILFAGGVYVPIDANLPSERQTQLLNDASIDIVLTQSWLAPTLNLPSTASIICVDDDELPVDEPGSFSFLGEQQPTDLAYVIYTSGSTGQPKGVQIDHRGALNTIADINRRFDIGPYDRLLSLSSLSFDLSVYDIFGTLAAGATLILPSAHADRDPAHWASLIAQEQVTIWNSVPASMQLLVEHARHHSLSLESLRLVLLSGDWIPVTLPDQLRTLVPHVQIISLGGATEASIWSVLYPIHDVDPAWSSIPYGTPMANQSLHVLHETLAPCPLWVAGELFIGGIGLAHGYLNDPEKTQHHFMTHPETGERLYRTGDIARVLPDGIIELLGREDQQVKIQGYRIELGELEAVLHRLPFVQAAAAIAPGEHLEKRLVAAVVLKSTSDDESQTIHEIRQALQTVLPPHMIPSTILLLDSLPLTSNGKVDRRALLAYALAPEPIPAPPTPAPPPADSATSPEATLRTIVAEVLFRDPASISLSDNWLERGATSVDIIRIINRIEERLQFRPSVGAIYRNPSLQTILTLYHEQNQSPVVSDALTSSPDASFPTAEAFTTHSPPQLILDAAERLTFKQSQPGIRTHDGWRARVALSPLTDDEYHRAMTRRSHRTFAHERIAFDRFSHFLSCLQQIPIASEPKYAYPSAGGVYPIQVFLAIKPDRIDGLAPGIYYYHPIEHSLIILAPDVVPDRTIHDLFVNASIYDGAAFSIFLVAQLRAMQPLYGEMARDFCLIEAGAMCQLLMMRASAYQLGLCPIGDLNFASIRHLFDMEQDNELVHSLLGGPVNIQMYAQPRSQTTSTDEVSYGVPAPPAPIAPTAEEPPAAEEPPEEEPAAEIEEGQIAEDLAEGQIVDEIEEGQIAEDLEEEEEDEGTPFP